MACDGPCVQRNVMLDPLLHVNSAPGELTWNACIGPTETSDSALNLYDEPGVECRILCALSLRHVTPRIADDSTFRNNVVKAAVHMPMDPQIDQFDHVVHVTGIRRREWIVLIRWGHALLGRGMVSDNNAFVPRPEPLARWSAIAAQRRASESYPAAGTS